MKKKKAKQVVSLLWINAWIIGLTSVATPYWYMARWTQYQYYPGRFLFTRCPVPMHNQVPWSNLLVSSQCQVIGGAKTK